MTTIGDLKRLVDFEKRKTGKDAANFPNQGWELHKKKWSAWASPTGMGSIRAAATNATGISGAQVGYSVRVRFDPSITQDMRVVEAGVIFEIKQVIHDFAGKTWTDVVVVQGGGRG